MIQIGINSEVLKTIVDGRKTVEGRLAKDKFLTIQPDDIISLREDIYQDNSIVESRNDVARIQVIEVKRFDSFRAMLSDVGFKTVIPHASTFDEALNEYSLYYSHDDERKYGVLGIAFRVVSS